jgi:hypothetical protein
LPGASFYLFFFFFPPFPFGFDLSVKQVVILLLAPNL